MAAATTVDTYTFAVYPSDFSDAFEGFLMDVPSTQGRDAAARRAYFTAMAHMAGRGFDVEDFSVAVWNMPANTPGPLVGPGGIEGQL